MKNKKTQVRYEVISQKDKDTDDILIPIPPELLRNLGWNEGEEIEIGLDSSGKYIFTRIAK